MGILTFTVAGANVAVIEGSPKYNDSLNQMPTCSFSIRDDTGTNQYSSGQRVAITDSTLGTIFTGYIHSAKARNLTPNAMNIIDVTCVSQQYLAQKAYARRDYANQDGGDIVADLHTNYLASLGVTAAYAMRHDSTAIQFGLGTLSNVVGSTNIDDGDLELKNAGSTVTVTETTTADFAAGTLTNVVAASNALLLNSVQAFQMTATSQQGANSNYTYFKIWAGSISVAAGDRFIYTIWISSSSPASTGGLSLFFSDGTTSDSMNVYDQNGFHTSASVDLSGYGVDKWYTRSMLLSPDATGKTLSYMTIGQAGTTNGTYTFYVRDAKVVDSTGTLKQQLMSGGTPSRTPTQLSDIGFSNVKLKTVNGYTDSGSRISPARAISSVGIVRSSLVSWSLALVDMYGNMTGIANDAQGPNKINYCSVESSIDGGVTWQSVGNHGSIQSLYAGASTTGLSVLFRETLRVAGPDPTVAPVLSDFTMTATPSYLTSVSNIQAKYNSSNWTSAGTHNNTMTGYYGDLNLNGDYRNWLTDTSPIANITLLGSGLLGANVSQPNSCLAIRCDASTDIRARLDDAGAWGDCTIECDIFLADAVGNYGVCYRGTGNNNNDTYAYNAYVDSSGVTLARGTNGGTGARTFVQQISVILATAQWYHLKIVASGTNHKIYLNDVLYINVTDSTYTSTGTIALRHYNTNASGGARHSGYFQAFGVQQNQSGTWISTGISLSGLGSFGSNLIQWNDDTPSNATLLIESSIDNGTTYATCTNNTALPGVVAGTSTSGKTLKLRASLTTQNANATPNLHGISVLITSAYTASGSRISPALNLSSAGTAGASSIIWNAVVPTNTTLFIDSSPDGSTWTMAGSGATGLVTIPGITTQPDPTDDTFDTNTASLYTSSARTGGTNAAWTWNTTQSRLEAVGGSNALLFLNSIASSTTDTAMLFDMDRADQAGAFLRYQNSNSYYYVDIWDSAASTTPNTVLIKKWSFGTAYNLDIARTINFVRGTPHRFIFSVVGNTLTLSMDGVQVSTYTDSSFPITNGQIGLNNTTGSARFYQLRVQPLGQSVIGQSIYTRARLASTDPKATPQLQDLTVSVRSPQLATGSIIPEAHYSVLTGSTNTLYDDLDDVAKKSNAVWKIDFNKALSFLARNGTPAPWIATAYDMLVSNLAFEISPDVYRNTEIIVGGTDIISRNEPFVGDGTTQTWPTSYKIQDVTAITVNGTSVTFGIQGVDSGKTFYYTPGAVGFSQDATLTPLDTTQIVRITYDGLASATVIMSDDTQIMLLSGIDGTDGIVEVVEDVSQQSLGLVAMLQLADARLIQYAVLIRTLTFTTMRDGLLSSQLLPVFLSQFSINDEQFLISDISTSWITTTQNNVTTQQPFYAVTCTDGPIVGDYAHYLSTLSK